MKPTCKHLENGVCTNADCIDEGVPVMAERCESCDCHEPGSDVPEVVEPKVEAPCIHADAEGFCQNPQSQGGGFRCCHCTDYAPKQEIAPVQPTFPMTFKHHTVQLPMGQALSMQYAKVGKAAGAAVREMVVFGAMLEKVDDMLAKNRYNKTDTESGRGESVKSWLEKNCPEINYNTAKSYQRAAEGVRVLVKMADDMPLLPLMGVEPITDEQMAKTREEVLGVISNSSLNVLRRAALPQPVGNVLKGTHGVAEGRRALTAEENAAEAEKMMREILGSVGAYLRGPWFGMLKTQSQDDFLNTLKHYTETVEDKMRQMAMDL